MHDPPAPVSSSSTTRTRLEGCVGASSRCSELTRSRFAPHSSGTTGLATSEEEADFLADEAGMMGKAGRGAGTVAGEESSDVKVDA